MNRLLSILAAMAVAAVGCSGDGDAPRSEPTTAPVTHDCDPGLAEGFAAWGQAGFSGSVAILDRDGFVCRAGFGWADRAAKTPNTADTVFSIGSISKACTAAAIFALVDAGRVDLDDRAGELVPGVDGPAARVTVRQLLLHRSGLTGSLGDDHRPLGDDAAIRTVDRLEPAFEPGTDYAYTNAGYSLLALIIEAVSGTTYRHYVASRILRLPGGDVAGGFWDGEPAASGPRAVGYLEDGSTGERGDFAGPHWALSGNGDVAMSMPALAAWAFADRYTRRKERSYTAGRQHGREAGSRAAGWVALDAEAYGEPVLAAAGGGGDVGHEAVVAWLPTSGRVIAVASNTPTVTAEELIQAVAPALVAGDPLPTPNTSDATVDPAELRAVAGRYEPATGGSFDVTASEDGLVISARGRDATAALFPGSSPLEATRHERRVVGLLTGGTRQGRLEQRALEAELGGRIDALEPIGTIVDGGELRTYVVVRSDRSSTLAWYAVDEAGGVAAASVDVDPPSLTFVPDPDGGYRPDDPTGTGPDLTVEFDGDRLTVTGPNGTTTARRGT